MAVNHDLEGLPAYYKFASHFPWTSANYVLEEMKAESQKPGGPKISQAEFDYLNSVLKTNPNLSTIKFVELVKIRS
jgi:hypothetical protein